MDSPFFKVLQAYAPTVDFVFSTVECSLINPGRPLVLDLPSLGVTVDDLYSRLTGRPMVQDRPEQARRISREPFTWLPSIPSEGQVVPGVVCRNVPWLPSPSPPLSASPYYTAVPASPAVSPSRSPSASFPGVCPIFGSLCRAACSWLGASLLGLLRRRPKQEQFLSCPHVFGEVVVATPQLGSWRWLEPERCSLEDRQLLGEGAYARVLLTQLDGEAVVVKVFKENGASTFAYVLREVDMAVHLAARGIGPPVRGVLLPGLGRTLPALVMEHLPGSVTLHTLLRQEVKMTRTQVVDLLRQAARLLALLHAEGFLHNDLQVSNLLVAPSGLQVGASGSHRPYLLDYGQATFRRGTHFSHGTEGSLRERGWRHLAPEVKAGAETTTASDVYSFGVLMTAAADLLRPELVRPGLLTFADRCLTPDPKDRPTMEWVESQLTILGRRPTKASLEVPRSNSTFHYLANKAAARRKKGLAFLLVASLGRQYQQLEENTEDEEEAPPASFYQRLCWESLLELTPCSALLTYQHQMKTTDLGVDAGYGQQGAKEGQGRDHMEPAGQAAAAAVRSPPRAERSMEPVSLLSQYFQQISSLSPDPGQVFTDGVD